MGGLVPPAGDGLGRLDARDLVRVAPEGAPCLPGGGSALDRARGLPWFGLGLRLGLGLGSGLGLGLGLGLAKPNPNPNLSEGKAKAHAKGGAQQSSRHA